MNLTPEDLQRLKKLMEKQLFDDLKNTMTYGRSLTRSELKDQELQVFPEHVGVDLAEVGGDRSVGYNPPFFILDEWGDFPEPQYTYDLDYVPDKDGPTSTRWTQPIPNPQAIKPASSPSSAKRAKLRSKRKKRK